MASLIELKEGGTGIRLPIETSELRIGREPDNDICIDDELVSKTHALIQKIDSPDGDGLIAYYIQDLDSTNRTYVNDNPMTLYRLKNEDVIRIGRHYFRFVDELEANLDDTTKLHKSWIPGVYYTKGKNKGRKKRS